MAYIKETLLIFCLLYTVSILALDPARKPASDFATFREYREYLKEYNKEKRDNRKEAFAERRTTTPKAPRTERTRRTRPGQATGTTPFVEQSNVYTTTAIPLAPAATPISGRETTVRPPTTQRASVATRPVQNAIVASGPKQTPDQVMDQCCRANPLVAEGCYEYCNYASVNKRTLTQLYTKPRECPRTSLKPWYLCAMQNIDNTECCKRKMIDKRPGKPLCLNLCNKSMEQIKIDASYLPCLNLVDTISDCFEQTVQDGINNGEIR